MGSKHTFQWLKIGCHQSLVHMIKALGNSGIQGDFIDGQPEAYPILSLSIYMYWGAASQRMQ